MVARRSASPRRAVPVRGLLVLAVGSLLAIAWAAGADSRPEDQVLTPPREREHSPDWAEGHAAARGSAGVPAGSVDQREEPPTQAEGPAGWGDKTAQVLLGPQGASISAQNGGATAAAALGGAEQHDRLASRAQTAQEHELEPDQVGDLARSSPDDTPRALSPAGPWMNSSSPETTLRARSPERGSEHDTVALRCTGSSCPAYCAAGYNGDYDGPCTACPAGTYGFGAPYTCGDSATCKNVARSCGSGSDACSTSQSSSFVNGGQVYDSSRALDGNTDGSFWNGACTATQSNYRAWWMVDFGTSRNIVMVEVYGRTDSQQDRLNGFSVRIGDSSTPDNNPTCSYSNPWPNPQSVLLPCKGRGRYLVIQLETTTTFLTLCEVYAWGPQPGWDWASECNNCPAGAHSAAAGAPPRLRPLRYMRLEA
jgi:hypothetical protein